MKDLNIPVFRAKKIDSDEYVIGYYYKQLEFSYILEHEINKQKEEVSMWGSGWGFNQILQKTQVDPTTLAIHFPDMLDSEGNKIFASLSKDGKGGDLLKTRGFKAPCYYDNGFVVETIMGECNLYMIMDKTTIDGIQK